MDVLIVEDERIVSLAIASMIEELGHRVLARLPRAEEALARLETDKPDLVLLDIRLEGEMDGIEAAGLIRDRWGIPFVFTSAYTDRETRLRADATEPYAFLPKPIGFGELKGLIAGFLSRS